MSNIGGLFKDSTKVIGLLLGITKDNVKAEHRAELLTFAVWKFLLTIKANEHEHLSESVIKAVSSMIPMTNQYVMKYNSIENLIENEIKSNIFD